jgi:double-strand break repair protein MRE11
MSTAASVVTQDDENVGNIFRILITNDNHVGFKEDDPVRQNDSLVTFEEIMQIGRNLNVDFVLHSGDLFDECRPNRFWMTSVMRLLQTHCFGDRDIRFQQLRTPYSKSANFEDPNRNIDMPIFMIHGNHDDPGGEYGCPSTMAAADMLETNLLVNYFGKVDNVDEEIEIRPLLFQKGASKVALYGLGNISDERLFRMFESKKVKFLAPPNHEEYFHVFAIHQNRFRGAAAGQRAKNCVHLSFLPSFLNLVVWAHEHECIPSPEHSVECGFYVLQSGSSIQTSLSQSEQAPKHVFLLEIQGSDFRIRAIPLLTVRTLVMDEIVLPGNIALNSNQSEDLMASKVEQLLRRGAAETSTRLALLGTSRSAPSMFSPIQPELPLVRLRVHVPPSPDLQDRVGNVHILNQKFGRQFTGKIANPGEILHVISKSKSRLGSGSKDQGVVSLAIEDEEQVSASAVDVQTIIFNYLGGEQGEALLNALTEPDFNDAVQDYVHRNDTGAIERFLKSQISEMNKLVVESNVDNPESVLELVKRRARELRNARASTADNENMMDLSNIGPQDRLGDSIALRAPSLEDEIEEEPTRSQKRTRSPSSVSSDEIFQDRPSRRGGAAKKASAKPRQKSSTAKKTTASDPMGSFPLSSNPIVAAFMSNTATNNSVPSTGAAPKRQWARRL